ncbi:MAG: DUF5655 domain-containing protein [Pseudomonadota bacterium]|nr:DUF5655 domain-containing protein [Pseudomonadota bacterium]
MGKLEDLVATQMANLATATNVPIEHWHRRVRERLDAGESPGNVQTWLRTEHGMGHGNAGMLVTIVGRGDTTGDELVEAQYAGAKAALRPIYEYVLAVAGALGDDVEVSPKKTSVSFRRNKQFALVTPATNSRIDLGFNFKGHAPTARLKEEPPGRMCSHVVRVTSVEDIDDEVLGWLRTAYAGA